MLCVSVQASSSASERSFSKAGLIVVAKRMVMTPYHVDDLHLVGWRMAENGWTTQMNDRQVKPKRRKKRKTQQKRRHRPVEETP